jgi:hypothetical protein
MSAAPRPYSKLYIKVWTAVAIFHGVVFFFLFVFGDSFLHLGHIVWSLLRWICRPII